MKYAHLFIALLLSASLIAFASAQSHKHEHSKINKGTDTLLVKDTPKKAVKDKYTCPMHPEVISDKPDKCPECGMALKKIESPKVKTQSVSYVCPMHSEVVSDKPGKCSKCGMKLVKAKSSPVIKKSHKMQKDTSMGHPDKMH